MKWTEFYMGQSQPPGSSFPQGFTCRVIQSGLLSLATAGLSRSGLPSLATAEDDLDCKGLDSLLSLLLSLIRSAFSSHC